MDGGLRLVLVGDPGPDLGRHRRLGREPTAPQALAVPDAERNLRQIQPRAKDRGVMEFKLLGNPVGLGGKDVVEGTFAMGREIVTDHHDLVGRREVEVDEVAHRVDPFPMRAAGDGLVAPAKEGSDGQEPAGAAVAQDAVITLAGMPPARGDRGAPVLLKFLARFVETAGTAARSAAVRETRCGMASMAARLATQRDEPVPTHAPRHHTRHDACDNHGMT